MRKEVRAFLHHSEVTTDLRARQQQLGDKIFARAVAEGVVLRGQASKAKSFAFDDSQGFEIDVSGLTLPVARAAVRHTMTRRVVRRLRQ